MNRLLYDRCAEKQQTIQSVSPLDHIMDTGRHEHCNKCRPELGLVGGTAVSHVDGNLVDLENHLRGQTRPSTKCPSYKFLPNNGRDKEYIKPVRHPKINTNMVHLPPCQFQTFPEVGPTPVMDTFKCPRR